MDGCKSIPEPMIIGSQLFIFYSVGELKDKPEVLKKKLTEAEKEETNKKIEEKELKDALERVSSGKTPGIDGIEREFLLRFWRLLGTTITQAT